MCSIYDFAYRKKKTHHSCPRCERAKQAQEKRDQEEKEAALAKEATSRRCSLLILPEWVNARYE